MSINFSSAIGRILAAGTVLAAGLACCLPARASAANPPANIPLTSVPAGCLAESTPTCESWAIGMLDAAHTYLGLAPYALPADFASLSADRQVLILSDLDRLAYGDPTISGLNAALTEAAGAGVTEAKDPRPPAAEAPWEGFGSDWASTPALVAYYLWMYDDGYPGPNADCTSPSAAGCWGHRHVILGEGLGLPQPVVMGVASGLSSAGRPGSALILSSHPGASVYYSWAQARAEGAGGESGSGEAPKEGGEKPTEGGEKPAEKPTEGGEKPAEKPTEGGEGPKQGGEQPLGGEEAETPCNKARGNGTTTSPGAHVHLVEELSTATHAHRFEASITVPALGTLRLTALNSSSCVALAGGHEFRGSGPASLRWSPGYHASFTVEKVGDSASLTLEVTKGSTTVLKLAGAPFAASAIETID